MRPLDYEVDCFFTQILATEQMVFARHAIFEGDTLCLMAWQRPEDLYLVPEWLNFKLCFGWFSTLFIREKRTISSVAWAFQAIS